MLNQHTNNTQQISKQYRYIWQCNGKKRVKVMTSLFEMYFLAFLFAFRENKSHFWNPETKPDYIVMFVEEIFDLENLTFFT